MSQDRDNGDSSELTKLYKISDDVDYLQDMIEKMRMGERNIDFKNLVQEFQRLASSMNKLSKNDDDRTPKENKEAKKILESIHELQEDIKKIERTTDSGRANSVRERLKKKLEDRKKLIPKMKEPKIELE